MSTGNMPNPPETPNRPGGAPPTSEGAGLEQTQEESQEPLSLAGDMARVIRDQADTIAQQLAYHSQLLLGVGAFGTDIVNARSTVLTLADSLDGGEEQVAEHALSRLAMAQVPQVNDRTLPYKLNAQVAGLLEGLVSDALSKAYGSDPARAKEARTLLEPIFQSANEQALSQPKGLVLWQAPGPGPNARS